VPPTELPEASVTVKLSVLVSMPSLKVALIAVLMATEVVVDGVFAVTVGGVVLEWSRKTGST
jgi:hypothetical protein